MRGEGKGKAEGEGEGACGGRKEAWEHISQGHFVQGTHHAREFSGIFVRGHNGRGPFHLEPCTSFTLTSMD
jgi:hypothetical protein